MSIEFLGNKRQLKDFLVAGISEHTANCVTCMDLFSGSGNASKILKSMGFHVMANDFLFFSTQLTKAVLMNHEAPAFEGIDFISNTDNRYAEILNYLNTLPGIDGYIYSHYSPASLENDGVARMYFTEDNAKKIDAIRLKIEEWNDYLSSNEKALLISDLLMAVARVSNIAGTYGCYMKHWKKKALSAIVLEPSEFTLGYDSTDEDVFWDSAESVIDEIECDLVYADPPYTKRQYSAYYHLLETIALYDNPIITGSTGLRNWKEKSSDFCYKRKALKALDTIVSKAKCRYFVLSYNNEGQMLHESIIDTLSKYGEVSVCETQYKKYKSNDAVGNGTVIERLYILRMECKDAFV